MTTTSPAIQVKRTDRLVLRILAAIAALIGLANAVFGGWGVLLTATAAGETHLELLTRAEIPHTTELPPLLVSAVFTHSSLVASGLSDASRVLLAVGEGIGVLSGVVVCGAIAYLLFSLSRGRPFARGLYALAYIAGSTLTLGTFLAQVVSGFGRMTAATELNPGANDVFVVGFEFNPTLWLVGIAVMALAFVFRAGARLQRDTEGLI